MKIIWATKRSVPLVSLGTKRPGRLKHGSSWSRLYSFMKGSFSGPLLCNAQTHTGSSLLSIASRNAQRQHWIHRKLFLCMWSIWFIFSSIQMAILTDSYFNNFFLASPNYISFLFVDVPEYEMPNGVVGRVLLFQSVLGPPRRRTPGWSSCAHSTAEPSPALLPLTPFQKEKNRSPDKWMQGRERQAQLPAAPPGLPQTSPLLWPPAGHGVWKSWGCWCGSCFWALLPAYLHLGLLKSVFGLGY